MKTSNSIQRSVVIALRSLATVIMCRLWCECIVTKRLKLRPQRFDWKWSKCLNVQCSKSDGRIHW